MGSLHYRSNHHHHSIQEYQQQQHEHQDDDYRQEEEEDRLLQFVDPDNPKARRELLRSDPLLDWYEDEMANLIFISLVVHILGLLGFGIFFFIESTTLTFSGRDGVLGAAVSYTILWTLSMLLHYGSELTYWLLRRKSTYNSRSLDNCRRVWNIRIVCIGLTTASLIILWVLYGTNNGMDMLKSYDEEAVRSHGGKHGDLMALHHPYRLTYPLLMLQLTLLQFIAAFIIYWNLLGYDMGDEQEMTDAYLDRWARRKARQS